MPLALQNLIAISLDLRHRLSPSLEACRNARQTSNILTSDVLDDINMLFMELATMPMTHELLAQSRIHIALSEMAEPGGGWPDALSGRAERVLERWEAELGSLMGIGQALWAGRMKGCVKVVARGGEAGSVVGVVEDLFEGRSKRSAWVIEGGKERGFSLRTGHIGFEVGDWWVKPAAALRDGIIHWAECGISADEEEAFAIVMTGNEELEANHKYIKYRPVKERWRTKLLRNIVTGNPVRVLRYCRLDSKFSPWGGLRYDGLYNVRGWSVRLIKHRDSQDFWQYTFNLERTKHQASMDKALVRPDLEEKEDWITYQKEKHSHIKTLDEVDVQKEGIMIAWSSKDSSPMSSHQDSGQ